MVIFVTGSEFNCYLNIMKRHVWLLFLTLAGVLLSGCTKKDDPMTIGVESVSLNKTSMFLLVRGTEQLVATVLPEEAANKTVVWSSDAEDVASVDASTGLVTALSAGTAKITATTEDGGYTASCTVTVTVEKYLKELLLDAFGKMGIGEDLFSENNWSLDNPLANWEGIHVSDGTADYELSIDFSGQPLNGTLCDELFRLPGLTRLDLHGCQFSGPIPESIGEATQLTYLNIENNDFTGELPSSLGNLTDLVHLNLSSNNLSGEIPAEIGNLTNLVHLNLRYNNLSGEIPAEIGNLTNLVYLSLFYNNLSGEIPAEIGNLTNLEALSLSSNNLSGEIPAAIGNLTNLEGLGLFSNNLSGEIPAEIGNLTKLKTLNLRYNNLSGEIPAAIGNLTNLVRLNLRSNNLSGEIPAAIGNLTNLYELYLSFNNLSGMIPDEVLNHPYFNNWKLTPQNDGYGFDNYPASSGMSKVRSLNDRPAEKEAVRLARKAEIRERTVREVR